MENFERVVIVGVGLLGGSIGMALRDRQLARRVVGVGRSLEALQAAVDLGAIDEAQTDCSEACRGADLAIVCTPVQHVVGHVQQCLAALPNGALVTDVGSTKRNICQQLDPADHQVFCGAHPLAGGAQSGVQHSQPGLFHGRTTVITPMEQTPNDLVARTERLWQELGSRTVRMTPEEHDEAVAQTSHLPHVVAAALAAATPDKLLPLAAAGWCDTTRVAGGNVELWMQILQENRAPVLDALRHYADSLQQWSTALQTGDSGQLESLLAAGKHKRDSLGN